MAGVGPRGAAGFPRTDRARAGRVRCAVESSGDGRRATGGRGTAASAAIPGSRSERSDHDDAVRLPGTDGGAALAWRAAHSSGTAEERGDDVAAARRADLRRGDETLDDLDGAGRARGLGGHGAWLAGDDDGRARAHRTRGWACRLAAAATGRAVVRFREGNRGTGGGRLLRARRGAHPFRDRSSAFLCSR